MTSRKTYKRSINLARITDPITEGNGWINVTVDDGVLPYMPGLDPSLPEQKARLSVFHQLHCLVSRSKSGTMSAESLTSNL